MICGSAAGAKNSAMFLGSWFLFELLVQGSFGGSIIAGLQEVPPPVKFGVNYDAFDNIGASRNFDDSDGFVWEKSGLFEGDIMFYSKNGLTDESFRWDNATIPFYIEEEHFSDSEIKTILSAVKEFHQKSCLRFKPYTSSDKNFVVVTGNQQGCWSSVGMKGEGGQQLNVNSPKCVKKGTVMHEFLHAAGFVHQQSASNRDEYVKIIWENISEGHESNFNKYNESHITDYGTSYDYKSIMHYSGKAFSKNGNDTIVALHNTTALGQRDGFTEKDLKKLNRMYNATCHHPEEEDANLANIIDWFRSLFT